MITEDYVSFETAKLLKEKGFDEPTVFRYGDYPDNNDLLFAPSGIAIVKNSETQPYFYSAPTLQMAMKWLREMYKIEIWIHYDIDKNTWWGGCNPMYEEDEENSNMFQNLLGFDYSGKTYEEACEAAIKYCLENLI